MSDPENRGWYQPERLERHAEAQAREAETRRRARSHSLTPTDHAELARLAEAATGDTTMGDLLIYGGPYATVAVRDFVSHFDPKTCSALLAEIAALRGRPLWSATEFNAIVEGLCKQLQAEMFRATQAERQRDEAVGLLRRYRADLPSEALEDITDSFLASMEPKT